MAAEVLGPRLDRLLGSGRHTVLVAEVSSGELVGWIHGSEVERLSTGRRGEILGLVVDVSHRGLGIGRSLVQAVEEWAVQRGLTDMAVRSNVARAESHPFYDRLGYQRIKTQHSYRKEFPAG